MVKKTKLNTVSIVMNMITAKLEFHLYFFMKASVPHYGIAKNGNIWARYGQKGITITIRIKGVKIRRNFLMRLDSEINRSVSVASLSTVGSLSPR